MAQVRALCHVAVPALRSGSRAIAPCPPLPAAAAEAAATTRSVPERSVLGLWTQLEMPAADKKPAPRYEAAAAVVGNAMYVLGGNYGALTSRMGGWVGCRGLLLSLPACLSAL